MTKEQIRCVKDGLSRQKLYIALGCIEELEKENEELKQQNAKMKCCHSCKSHKLNNLKNCQTCDNNYSNWEFAE